MNQKEALLSIDTTRSKTIVLVLLTISLLIGNQVSFGIRIAGLTITLFRFMIPLSAFCLLWQCNQMRIRELSAWTKWTALFLCFWLLYGGILLVSGGISHEGAKELMQLLLSVIAAFLLCVVIRDYSDLMTIRSVIQAVLWGMLLLALIEILTAWHLPTSRFCDQKFMEEFARLYPAYADSFSIRNVATGAFYNPNDLCAFLAVFSPVLLPYVKQESKFRRCMNAVAYVFLFVVLLKDDAWICIFGMLAAFILYSTFYLIKSKSPLPIILFILMGVAYKFAIPLLGVMSAQDIPSNEVTVNALQSIGSQFDGISRETGSVFLRLNTYGHVFTAFIEDTFGFGFGPYGVQEYLAGCQQKCVLASPHGFWIELLANYGFLVFCGFIIMCFGSFIILSKRLTEWGLEYKMLGAFVLAMDVSLAVDCMAPSAFLTTTYYWLPVGITLALAAFRIEPRNTSD